MNKKLIILLLAISGVLKAQDNYMSLSFGVGTALGDFAGVESLANNGYATQGFMADYSGAYYPIDKLGLGASIKFNQNGVNKTEVSDALLELLPSDPSIPVENKVFDLGYWKMVSVGLGPQLTLPSSKINFDLYAYPGLYIVMPPKMQLTALVDGEPATYSAEAQNLRFGFEAGAAIRYRINSTSALRLFTSYMQTSSKGEILSELAGQAGNTNVDFSTKIQVFNIGLGLVYGL